MKKIRIIDIDGFKYDYLEHAPYLKSLTEQYQHGKVTVPLGFWGAMDVFFNGKTDLLGFFYYTPNSSWKSSLTTTNLIFSSFNLISGKAYIRILDSGKRRRHFPSQLP